jgi:hypothetical protein
MQSIKNLGITPVIALILLAPASLFAQNATMFPDVPRNHWAYDAVKSLKDKGILQGYPAEPARQGKRTVVQLGQGKQTVSPLFQDLFASHWAYNNLRQLHNKGLIEIITASHQRIPRR